MDVLYKATVVAENGLPVKYRKEPSKDSPVAGKANCGTVVDVFSDNDGWSCIRISGGTYYMMSKFLKQGENSAPAEDGGLTGCGLYIYEKLSQLEKRIKLLEDAGAEG